MYTCCRKRAAEGIILLDPRIRRTGRTASSFGRNPSTSMVVANSCESAG